MKLFRRISALALAIVMVCLLSASAFAADYSYTKTFNDPDECSAMTFTNVDRYATDGELVLDTPDAAGNYITIDIECDYYELITGVEKHDSNTVTVSYYNEWSGTAVKSYEQTYINGLSKAESTYYASFNNYTGYPLEFNFNPTYPYAE